MELIKYNDFINEEASMNSTFWDDTNKNLVFFSTVVEKNPDKYPLFLDFFRDRNNYYGLSLVKSDIELYKLKGIFRDCRITLLTTSSYRDTETLGNKNLKQDELREIVKDLNKYYVYHLVKGPRRETAPDREHFGEIISHGDKRWYFLILRNKSCNLIKTKSRQESGMWAEDELSRLYGWKRESKKIKIIFKTPTGPIEKSNGIIKTIFETDDDNPITIEENLENWTKYDLIIGDEKIEVKKYEDGERSIWVGGPGGYPIPIMLAEQIRMANKSQLISIIKWFLKFKINTRQVRDLLSLSDKYRKIIIETKDKVKEKYINELVYQFSTYNIDYDRPEICDTIKDFYNNKIERLLRNFNMNQDKWMTGVKGIYFVTGNDRLNRRNDFLIKIKEEDGTRNIEYNWFVKEKWLGFKELILMMTINGDAWEYILTEGNNFEKVFQLSDYQTFEDNRNKGILMDTESGNFRYDTERKLWFRV